MPSAEPLPEPALMDAVSPLFGLVRRLSATTAVRGLPSVLVTDAEPADPRPTLQQDVDSRAGGAAPTFAASAASATGEAVERYSAGFIPYGRLLFGTAAELGVPALPPPHWWLRRSGDDSGHPSEPVTDETALGWVRAERLHDGGDAAVPAQWVYLGYGRAPGEPLLLWTTSTGLACAPDLPAAVLRGLLEVIERDAFLRVWRQRRTMPRVRLGPLLDRHPALRRAVELPDGARLSLVDLSSIAVAPTMLATVRHPHPEQPALAVGAASALTPLAAATKAVIEACHTAQYAAALRRLELRRRAAGLPPEGTAPGEDAFDEHVRQYVDPERAAAADFLDAGPVDVELASACSPAERPASGAAARAAARRLAARLADEGVQTFAVDVTAPDVAELGLHVARVRQPAGRRPRRRRQRAVPAPTAAARRAHTRATPPAERRPAPLPVTARP